MWKEGETGPLQFSQIVQNKYSQSDSLIQSHNIAEAWTADKQ